MDATCAMRLSMPRASTPRGERSAGSSTTSTSRFGTEPYRVTTPAHRVGEGVPQPPEAKCASRCERGEDTHRLHRPYLERVRLRATASGGSESQSAVAEPGCQGRRKKARIEHLAMSIRSLAFATVLVATSQAIASPCTVAGPAGPDRRSFRPAGNNRRRIPRVAYLALAGGRALPHCATDAAMVHHAAATHDGRSSVNSDGGGVAQSGTSGTGSVATPANRASQ